MKHTVYNSLLTKNKIGKILKEDHVVQQDYLELVRAFARLTYESVYIIDYETMTFEFVSENPLFLCGYTAKEVQNLGYDFYFKNVPPKDLKLLTIINEAGFDFFEKLPVNDRKKYSISYDFHLVNKNGKATLINHRLTPLFLTSENKIWKAMCIVSIAHHQQAGNVVIKKQGADEILELDVQHNIWRKSGKPKLTERETEVLKLYAQGLTIDQISKRIFVSPDTVKYYRRRIFSVLDVHNITEALSYAINSNII